MQCEILYDIVSQYQTVRRCSTRRYIAVEARVIQDGAQGHHKWPWAFLLDARIARFLNLWDWREANEIIGETQFREGSADVYLSVQRNQGGWVL